MKNTCSSIKQNLLGIMLAGAGIAFAANASAANVGAGVGVGVGADVNAQAGSQNGVKAGGGAQMDGSADAQMSPEGSLNQNSQMLPDATRGMDRAQERMSPMGAEVEQATGKKETDKKTAKRKRDKKSTDMQ